MPAYNFKSIKVVPSAKDFIDIVLSKTQRQTPTVVHKGWNITRIRQFYMRKVKFTQQTWHAKLIQILTDFPKINEIHPFYGDLLNVLYDKDHYKLALGQLNVAKNLIDKIAQDYIRLLKYGDSLYRCKELKKAALGRMCTLMKKQTASLQYLEQIRQHMSRLPSIDPSSRTLLLCGFPNVGKSSFMNKVTRADVEVQPYAFTTKALYIGHMDYQYLRWQVIDTPGVLDRPLEERNTIEMQSITALAHIRASVLYIVDISEQCGYSIKEQAQLFHSIKALFNNKPVFIVCNKIDQKKLEDLTQEDQQILLEMGKEAFSLSQQGIYINDAEILMNGAKSHILSMSTLTELGVMDVKQLACDKLVEMRVETKLKGKKINDIMNRIYVAMPKMTDVNSRKPNIPQSFIAQNTQSQSQIDHHQQLQQQFDNQQKQSEKQKQEIQGGAGVYSQELRDRFLLQNKEWNYDIQPEIYEGHNVTEFIDPDIDAKLEQLEIEEENMQKEYDNIIEGSLIPELTEEENEWLSKIKARKAKLINDSRAKKVANQSFGQRLIDQRKTKTIGNMEQQLQDMGFDSELAVKRVREKSVQRIGRKRERSNIKGMDIDGDDVDMQVSEQPKKRFHSTKSRSLSRGRSLTVNTNTGKRSQSSVQDIVRSKGLRDIGMQNKAMKMGDKSQRKFQKNAKKGEGDRHIPNFKPKHLFSGKRGVGKTDRR